MLVNGFCWIFSQLHILKYALYVQKLFAASVSLLHEHETCIILSSRRLDEPRLVVAGIRLMFFSNKLICSIDQI
jgi:hypothetical protein